MGGASGWPHRQHPAAQQKRRVQVPCPVLCPEGELKGLGSHGGREGRAAQRAPAPCQQPTGGAGWPGRCPVVETLGHNQCPSPGSPLGGQPTDRTSHPPPPTGLGAQAHPRGQWRSQSPAGTQRTAAGHLALAASPAPRPSPRPQRFRPKRGETVDSCRTFPGTAALPGVQTRGCRPGLGGENWWKGQTSPGGREKGRAPRSGAGLVSAGEKEPPRSAACSGTPCTLSHTHLPRTHHA